MVKERLGELYDWLQEYSDGGPGQYESAYYTKSYRKNLRHFIKGKASSVPAYQLLESVSSLFTRGRMPRLRDTWLDAPLLFRSRPHSNSVSRPNMEGTSPKS